MTALPAELDLGGKPAFWWWLPNVHPAVLPAGVEVDHGDHILRIPWVPVDTDSPFTLDALTPLTVAEQIKCTTCGVTGFIQQGAWLPVDEGS